MATRKEHAHRCGECGEEFDCLVPEVCTLPHHVRGAFCPGCIARIAEEEAGGVDVGLDLEELPGDFGEIDG